MTVKTNFRQTKDEECYIGEEEIKPKFVMQIPHLRRTRHQKISTS